MYEKDKGMNDWKIESLGNLKNMKFIEDSPLIYTLSTSGVLCLYDTLKQKHIWKKELPDNEEFSLRYLGRNLLVYSQKRAMMINSRGHIIYDL